MYEYVSFVVRIYICWHLSLGIAVEVPVCLKVARADSYGLNSSGRDNSVTFTGSCPVGGIL